MMSTVGICPKILRWLREKRYLEEWEKVDVAQSYASGEDKSGPTATATKIEGVQKTQEDEAVVLCPSHRGKQLVRFTHHHGSTQVPKKTLFHEDLRELSRTRMRALDIFYPSKAIWRFSQKVSLAVLLMKRSYLVTRKMSCPYGMILRRGKSLTVRPFSSVTSSTQKIGISPAYREAPARRHSPSSSGYHFDNNMPNRSAEQTRLSVYNWNPGRRRGKEGAIERHNAGKWHIITLQEATEYLEHDFLTNRFHVTHHGGCSVLFNKDTFFSDIKVSSVYLHDTRACEQDKIKEGESVWVLQGVVSKISFSTATAQWPNILHGDVSAQQQQLRHKAWSREEASPHYPRHHA